MDVTVTREDASAVLPKSAGRNIGRMLDLAAQLGDKPFLASPLSALGACLYHADLSNCLERAAQDSRAVAVTPEVVWFAFVAGLAGRVRRAPEALKQFQVDPPVVLPNMPYANGRIWPVDEIADDFALLPTTITQRLAVYTTFAIPAGADPGDFSHPTLVAAIACHDDLLPAIRLGGSSPVWHPRVSTLSVRIGRPDRLSGLEVRGNADGWRSAAAAVRVVARHARDLGDAGGETAEWADAVAAAFEVLGDAVGTRLADHPLVADPADKLACGLARLLAPVDGMSQIGRVAFTHADRAMALHFGVFWSSGEDKDKLLVPEVGWVLTGPTSTPIED